MENSKPNNYISWDGPGTYVLYNSLRGSYANEASVWTKTDIDSLDLLGHSTIDLESRDDAPEGFIVVDRVTVTFTISVEDLLSTLGDAPKLIGEFDLSDIADTVAESEWVNDAITESIEYAINEHESAD